MRAARDRAGDVVPNVPTPLCEIGDFLADAGARLLIFLRGSWGEPYREAGADERSGEEPCHESIVSRSLCYFVHGA